MARWSLFCGALLLPEGRAGRVNADRFPICIGIGHHRLGLAANAKGCDESLLGGPNGVWRVVMAEVDFGGVGLGA